MFSEKPTQAGDPKIPLIPGYKPQTFLLTDNIANFNFSENNLIFTTKDTILL